MIRQRNRQGRRSRDEIINLQSDGSVQLISKARVYYINTSGKPKIVEAKYFFVVDDADYDAEEMERLLDEQLILFKRDDELHGSDVMKVQNQEIRRQLIRRMGYRKFLHDVRGEIIHRDHPSQLIRIRTPRGQDDYCFVRVVCPSTHDTYILRVPPDMQTCKQAVAWTFGMTEEEYNPEIET